MSAEQVWNCCVALDTDPNTLLGWWLEHPREEEPAQDGPEREMAEAFRGLSDEGREVAAKVVSGMRATYPRGDGQPGMVAGSA